MVPLDAYWEMEQDARELLQLLPQAASARKLRCFICECLRSALSDRPDPDDAEALALAERIADEANVDPAEWTAVAVREGLIFRTRVASSSPFHASTWLALAFGDEARAGARGLVDILTDAGLGVAIPLRLLREVFGNPFRPVAFAPWRTATATALARGMYESRDFGAMPILADALQDAGCDNADVLAHCRDPHATHVRGCWVVDGVLGKE